MGKQNPEVSRRIPLPRPFGEAEESHDPENNSDYAPTTPPKSPCVEPAEPQCLVFSGGGVLRVK